MGFIQKIVFHILATAAIFWGLSTYVFPTTFQVNGGLENYAIIAILFGGMNTLIKPLLKLITFPIHFITMGLSSFILNAGMLWLWSITINTLQLPSLSINIQGLETYLLMGIILSVANVILHWFER